MGARVLAAGIVVSTIVVALVLARLVADVLEGAPLN
jgi:hypothetical protein